MSINTHVRRAVTVVGGTTAAIALAAGSASAHHCLKEWNDAARAQVSSGTPWMELSDFVGFAIENFLPGGTAACAAHADEFTSAYMAATGTATEPTVHMKATAAGGALHQGKTTKPISEINFGALVGVVSAEPDCAGIDWS